MILSSGERLIQEYKPELHTSTILQYLRKLIKKIRLNYQQQKSDFTISQ